MEVEFPRLDAANRTGAVVGVQIVDAGDRDQLDHRDARTRSSSPDHERAPSQPARGDRGLWIRAGGRALESRVGQ